MLRFLNNYRTEDSRKVNTYPETVMAGIRLKRAIGALLVAVPLCVTIALTFLVYSHHNSRMRVYHEQRQALTTFATANASVSLVQVTADSLRNSFSWFHDYSIFVGVVIYDLEENVIIWTPPNFYLPHEVRGKLSSDSDITFQSVSYTMVNVDGPAGEELGRLYIAFTDEPIQAETRTSLMYTFAIGLLLLLPVMVILARRIFDLERSVHDTLLVHSAIIQSSIDSVISMSRSGVITEFNASAEDTFGYTRQEALGKKIDEEIISVRCLDQWRTILSLAIPTGNHPVISRCEDMYAVRANGEEFPIELTLGHVQIRRESIFVTFIRDLSEQRQEEKVRKELVTRVSQSEKLQAIGTLAGGIAHDFNNLLSSIIGYAELVKMTLSAEDKRSKQLSHVLTAGQRGKELVNQIMTFSRRKSTERRPVELAEVVREALKLLKTSIPSNIEIREFLDSDLVSGPTLADPSQIHQVVMNLCINAVHAMSEGGGVLDISIDQVELPSEFTNKFISLFKGEYLRLTIRDTGTGMDSATKERIFEPFFTTKNAVKPTGLTEGTGLGLFTVYRIIRDHGGAISVHSEIGSGTTFFVYLPFIKTEVAPEERAKGAVPLGLERILVVDDEELLANMLKDMLRPLGYKVTALTSSRTALEMFRETPTAWDLVITDQIMPDMTGVELAKELNQINPNFPIIMISGFSETVSRESASKLGISDFIAKPFTMRELAQVVRGTLDRSKISTPTF